MKIFFFEASECLMRMSYEGEGQRKKISIPSGVSYTVIFFNCGVIQGILLDIT